MKKLLLLLCAMSLSLMASTIEIKDAYARATPPNLPNSAAFMTIVNHSNENIALIKAQSNVAKAVELHTHDMKDGVMKMYQVPQIDVAANTATVLQPGGFHIMFIGLNQKPLKVGDEIQVTLQFSNNETQTITLPVKTVMGGMMKQHNKAKMSCGQGKCGSNMTKGMSCGQGKCGSN